jgi:hypothetical protein
VFSEALEVLANPAAAKRTVIILLAGGWNHAFHYHAQVSGARYTSWRALESGSLNAETWLEIGNARVSTISWRTGAYEGVRRFDVAAGDEIWVFGMSPFPDSKALQKLPGGLSLAAADTFNPRVRVFHVINNREILP